eukprot:2526439-Amphidinium_carterae.3
MMHRPSSNKKLATLYTRSREVGGKLNRRRNPRRDVEGNFFIYGKENEVVQHLIKRKSCPKRGNDLSRERVRYGKGLDKLRCQARGCQHRFNDLASSNLHVHWQRRHEDPVLHHVQYAHRDPTDQHQVAGWMFPGCHR